MSFTHLPEASKEPEPEVNITLQGETSLSQVYSSTHTEDVDQTAAPGSDTANTSVSSKQPEVNSPSGDDNTKLETSNPEVDTANDLTAEPSSSQEEAEEEEPTLEEDGDQIIDDDHDVEDPRFLETVPEGPKLPWTIYNQEFIERVNKIDQSSHREDMIIPLDLTGVPLKSKAAKDTMSRVVAQRRQRGDEEFLLAWIRTYGKGLLCGLWALAQAIAGHKQFSCKYKYDLEVLRIKNELHKFITSNEFKTFAEGIIQDCGIPNSDKVIRSLMATLKDKKNFEIEFLCMLVKWWEQKEGMPANSIRVIMLNFNNVDGKLAITGAADRYGDNPGQIQMQVVIRSINSNKDYGHYEGYSTPFPGFEDELSPIGRWMNSNDPFLQKTDPRLNGGKIVSAHLCTKVDDCTNEHLRTNYNKDGDAGLKGPAEPPKANSNHGTGEKDPNAKDGGKDERDPKSKDGAKVKSETQDNSLSTGANDQGEKSTKKISSQYIDLGDDNDDDIDQQDPASLAITEELDAEGSKAGGKTQPSGQLKLQAKKEEAKTIPTVQNVLDAINGGDEDLYKDTPLVQLPSPKDPAEAAPCREAALAIAFFRQEETDKLMPDPFKGDPYGNASARAGSVRLSAAFGYFGVAPYFKITATFVRKDHGKRKDGDYKLQHTVTVKWFLGQSVVNKNHEEVSSIVPSSLSYEWYEDPKLSQGDDHFDETSSPTPVMYLDLNFTSRFAICQNLSLPDAGPLALKNLQLGERQVYRKLAKLCNATVDGEDSPVRVRLYPYNHEAVAYMKKGPQYPPALRSYSARMPQNGADTTNTPLAFHRKSFYGHRREGPDNFGELNYNFGNMRARQSIIATDMPLMNFKSVLRFLDQDHGNIALSFGVFLDFQEEKLVLDALMKEEHIGIVHPVGNDVLVGIIFSKRPSSGIPGDYFSINPDTPLNLRIKSNREKQGEFEVQGRSMEQTCDMTPTPDLVVLLNERDAPRVAPLGRARTQSGQQERFVVTLEADQSDTTARACMDAVRKAYDPHDKEGAGTNLLPLVLYDGTDKAPSDPFDGQPHGDQAYDDLCNAMPYNDSQKDVLSTCKDLMHRVGLVTGPGGSGKTEMMAHQANAALACGPGNKVLMISERNAVCDNQLDRYVQAYPKRKPPVRAYAQLGNIYKFGPKEAEPKKADPDRLSPQEKAVLDMIDHLRKQRKKKRMDQEEYSVEGTVLRYMEEGKVLMHSMTATVQDASGETVTVPDPEWEGGEVNVFEYIRTMLDQLNAKRRARREQQEEVDRKRKADRANRKKQGSAKEADAEQEEPVISATVEDTPQSNGGTSVENVESKTPPELPASSTPAPEAKARKNGKAEKSKPKKSKAKKSKAKKEPESGPTTESGEKDSQATTKPDPNDSIGKDAEAEPSAQAGEKVEANTNEPSSEEHASNVDNRTEARTKDPASKENSSSADEDAKIPLLTDNEERWFSQAMRLARAYVISDAEVLVCTTVNCASDEVRKHFASNHFNDTTEKRVWVFVDEATTITEPSMLIPLAKCYPTFGKKIVSVWMYGDLRQLGPVVLGGNGDNNTPVRNEFGQQLRIPLFNRLVGCGFPCIQLKTQCRMHPVIFEHANKYFYDEEIQDDPRGVDLPEGYEDMLRKMINVSGRLLERQKRLVYFEVAGDNCKRGVSGSRANLANIDCIMNLIKGPLHELYGKNMANMLAIIVPYRRQQELYNAYLQELREAGWTQEELPVVVTIDSCIGREFPHAILDYVVCRKSAKGMGFLTDDKRGCVFHTRARQVLWIVGGNYPDVQFNPIPILANTQPAQEKSSTDKQSEFKVQDAGEAPLKSDEDDESDPKVQDASEATPKSDDDVRSDPKVQDASQPQAKPDNNDKSNSEAKTESDQVDSKAKDQSQGQQKHNSSKKPGSRPRRDRKDANGNSMGRWSVLYYHDVFSQRGTLITVNSLDTSSIWTWPPDFLNETQKISLNRLKLKKAITLDRVGRPDVTADDKKWLDDEILVIEKELEDEIQAENDKKEEEEKEAQAKKDKEEGIDRSVPAGWLTAEPETDTGGDWQGAPQVGGVAAGWGDGGDWDGEDQNDWGKTENEAKGGEDGASDGGESGAGVEYDDAGQYAE